MNQEKIKIATKLISEKLLTPLLYKLDDQDSIKFIGFFDTNIDEEDITNTEAAVASYLDVSVEIIDIRNFEMVDIIDIVENSEIVYSTHPIMENFFGNAIMGELEMYKQMKSNYIERKNSTGTCYIQ